MHRDLKPANILLTENGPPSSSILAWRNWSSLRTTMPRKRGREPFSGAQHRICRPSKPKEGRLTNDRTYSASAQSCTKSLSGRRAFAGDSVAQVLSGVLRDDPPALQTTPALQQIVRKCLAKSPADRFQTVTDLKAALEQARGPGPSRQPSIAVLPFANMSGDKEQEYFSDGLAEEILNALAEIPGLKVIARTSAFAFKGQNTDIRRIAETLGVDNILEGSVRRSGNRIRVTAQLITAIDGTRLWSDRYDREMADVFTVQDEISASIAAILKNKLMAGPEGARSYIPNIAAYEAYLNAVHHQWSARAPNTRKEPHVL